MRVLYVCTGNSFRSPVAEALTRHFRHDLEAESVGTDAADNIASGARVLLEHEDALKYVKPKPDQISERAVREADKIVCMMPDHRDYVLDRFDVHEGDVEVWNIEDPIDPKIGPVTTFKKIKENVEDL